MSCSVDALAVAAVDDASCRADTATDDESAVYATSRESLGTFAGRIFRLIVFVCR